jgi:hypothetical protein
MSQTTIKCPNCGEQIDVDEVFKHQAEESLKQEYTDKLSKELSVLKLKKEAADDELLKIKKLKEEQDDIIRAKLIQERKKIVEESEFKAKKDLEFEILKIKQDSEIKTKENLQLKKKEVEILNKERELREKEDQLNIDLEKKMLDKSREIEAKAIRREQEKNELKQKEYQKQIESQTRIITEFDKKEFEMMSRERELKDKAEQIRIDMEIKMADKLKEFEEKAKQEEKEKKELLSIEYEKKISEQRKLLEEKDKREEELLQKEKELVEQSGRLRIEMEKQMREKAKLIEDEALKESRLKEEEYEKKLEEQKKNIDLLKRKEIEMLNQQREAIDREEQLKLDLEKQMLDREKEIRDKAVRIEQEKHEMKNREYDKMLEDQKRLIDELKKKAEQGSQQLQGEVQELAIEEFLKNNFPFDNIMEVKKGQRGADAIQIVRNNLQQECGKIIYESKRTQAFSDKWIEKLKDDQKNQQAEIAVIVTEAMPGDMEKFGQRQGVWICNYNEIKSLALVLREMLIMTHSVKSVQENKGDKMEMLYSYVTSNEFAQQVETIVEGFHGMLNDLNKEKTAMEKIWSSREKQIRKVLLSTGAMHGSIKGIAGNAIANIKILELPDPEDINS